MNDLTWRDAIIKVLEDNSNSMHYTEIADQIVTDNLRTELGATPAYTVSSVITTDIKKDSENSIFARTAPGEYILRRFINSSNNEIDKTKKEQHVNRDNEPLRSNGYINSFGMYWKRESIHWNNSIKLWGQQSAGSKLINFSDQIGIYILYDDQKVVYVGRTADQTIGKRLFQHTVDRLNGRWNRFSWFGLKDVNEDGSLREIEEKDFNSTVFIITLESIMIEALEAPLNRKAGDLFRGIEYIQGEDPEITKRNLKNLLSEIQSKF